MKYTQRVTRRDTGAGAYVGKGRRTVIVYLGTILLVVGVVAFQARSVLFFPSTARSRISAAAADHAVYLVGGLSPNGMFLDDVLRVDTETLRMRRAARLPSGLIGCEAVTTEGVLLVLGGYTGSGVVDTVLRLGTRRGTMESIGRLPGPRAFGAVVVFGGRVFYLGGWDGSRVLDDIVVFDAATGESTVAGRLPSPRQYAGAAAFEGRIILAGGEDGSGETCAELLELDPSTLVVVRSVSMPQPPAHPRLVVQGGRILCYDGFADDPLGALVVLDPVTLRGSKILGKRLPTRDPNMALAASTGAVFLAGGIDPQNPRQPVFLRISLEPDTGGAGGAASAEVTALALRTFLLLR